MRLADVAEAIPPALRADTADTSLIADIEITDVAHDSRAVSAGSLFACVVGETVDGHDYAAAAIEAGASALLVQRPLSLDVPQVTVTNVRAAMGHAAAAVHGHPSRDLTIVGITGTNGKTTTAHMVAAILRHAGHRTEVLGTLSGARTTPEATDLQRLLSEFRADHVDSVVMEVSSHAMVYDRVVGTEFDAVVFLNLGHDHLDLHRSQEAYFRAKAALFDPAFAPVGVANLDDPSGQLLVDAGPIEMHGFGRDDVGDVTVTAATHAFAWRGVDVEVPIGGDVNVANSLAALTVAELIGIEPDVAAAGLSTLEPVPGRFEMVSDPVRDRVSVIVDYAVTPEALEELLRSARGVAGERRVIAVFGAAGDRDHDKRAPMGATGARLADLAIVTSDNPRSEDPQSIVDAVIAGVEADDRDGVSAVVDRRMAIDAGIRAAAAGDLVVIAGKGHESTQTIGDEKRPFDDRVVAREVLDDLAATPGEPS